MDGGGAAGAGAACTGGVAVVVAAAAGVAGVTDAAAGAAAGVGSLEAAQVLAEALAAQPVAGRTFAVAGILQDKDAAAIGAALQGVIDGWVLVGLPGERGGDPEALRRRLPEARRSLALAPDVEHGCGAALALAQRGDRIVVLGSFLTVGPALDWLGL